MPRRCVSGVRKIVRHVVERAAHAAHERFDAIEHGVEEHRQLIDGVAVGSWRDALIGPARVDDPAHCGRQPVNGLQRRFGQQPAAAPRR